MSGVGPVLEASELGRAVLEAIRVENPEIDVRDRGSYLRVVAPRRCAVSRAAIERVLGRPFRLPGDLEMVMPSFSGRLTVNEDGVVWDGGDGGTNEG